MYQCCQKNILGYYLKQKPMSVTKVLYIEITFFAARFHLIISARSYVESYRDFLNRNGNCKYSCCCRTTWQNSRLTVKARLVVASTDRLSWLATSSFSSILEIDRSSSLPTSYLPYWSCVKPGGLRPRSKVLCR